VKRSGDLEYACARIGARVGERPNEAAWRAIAGIRGFAAFLDAARTPPFRRWTSGIAADAEPHGVEAVLLTHWRVLVDELRAWMPEQWQAAITWAGALGDLPVAQYLARGGIPLPWMRDDPAYRELSCNGGPPTSGPLAPLARTWTNPEGFFRVWIDEWSLRIPRRYGAERSAIADYARLLVADRTARTDSSGSDGTLARRALVSRLAALYRRAMLDPAAAFIFLALSAIDMERLRGELLRRAIFRRLGRG
jgi:hypothetical protein